jgi:hypothetical protein
LTNLVAVVLLLELAILAITFVGSQRTIRALSQSLIDPALDVAEVELSGFFDPVSRRLRTCPDSTTGSGW